MTRYLLCTHLSGYSKTPVRGSIGAAGLDVFSAYDYVISPGKRIKVLTDLAIDIPKGYYGRMAPRSGLSLTHCIDVGAGVVDSDYRGNVGIVLINNGESEFVVKRGDKIAQMILTKYMEDVIILEVLNLSVTERGDKGFGSTDAADGSI